MQTYLISSPNGHRLLTGLLLAVAMLLGACGSGAETNPLPTSIPAPSTTIRVAPTAMAPTTTMAYLATIEPLDVARVPLSWKPGCPVELEELHLLSLPYVTFSGEVAVGELVVHADVAEAVVTVFQELYRLGYPIERMQLVDDFAADDVRSMNANNTSGYNCREIAGRPGVWSEHAYGKAVDLNPVQNPYLRADGTLVPEAGVGFLDRDGNVPGVITAGDEVVAAFAGIGWSWGGTWSNPDYQHFSATGR